MGDPLQTVIEPGKRANRFMRLQRDEVIADMQSRSAQGRRDAKKRWDKGRSPNRSPNESPNESGYGSPIGDRMQEYSKEKKSKEQGLDGLPISTQKTIARTYPGIRGDVYHIGERNHRPSDIGRHPLSLSC